MIICQGASPPISEDGAKKVVKISPLAQLVSDGLNHNEIVIGEEKPSIGALSLCHWLFNVNDFAEVCARAAARTSHLLGV